MAIVVANMGSYGEGGGYCCIMLPDKWRPGLKAHVEWELDPNPNEYIPFKKKGSDMRKKLTPDTKQTIKNTLR